jgi:anti-sigma B factor antagonist
MQVSVQADSGFNILRLEGEVDLQVSPDARSQILNCLKSATPLLVDLSAVSYMDSSGIATLVEGLQTARAQGAAFGLLKVNHPVMQVLKLARLDQVFTLYSDIEAFRDAIKS